MTVWMKHAMLLAGALAAMAVGGLLQHLAAANDVTWRQLHWDALLLEAFALGTLLSGFIRAWSIPSKSLHVGLMVVALVLAANSALWLVR
jgi:hypothetical protein